MPPAQLLLQERHVALPCERLAADGCLICPCGACHQIQNLKKTELYEQAIKYEKGSFITSTGALATLSGAKTGRSPRDKRVVKDEAAAQELWWGK